MPVRLWSTIPNIMIQIYPKYGTSKRHWIVRSKLINEEFDNDSLEDLKVSLRKWFPGTQIKVNNIPLKRS